MSAFADGGEPRPNPNRRRSLDFLVVAIYKVMVTALNYRREREGQPSHHIVHIEIVNP